MSFNTPWLNVYNSIMLLQQDPATGMLKGTYASTTDGSGTYDVVGWAALPNATAAAGQPLAISILWRSNDGGKSDPSHEVSTMAGQVVATATAENLVLLHLFVETKENTVPAPGVYPDKLVFVPTETPASPSAPSSLSPSTSSSTLTSISTNNLTGTWFGSLSQGLIQITFEPAIFGDTRLTGTITYPDGSTYPLAGFTDIFASSGGFAWQGITFSTYVNDQQQRTCIGMAGYLNLNTGKIHLTQIAARSTDAGSTWYQTSLEQWSLEKEMY